MKNYEKTNGNKSQGSTSPATNFIKMIIDEDLKVNKNEGRVMTRFPPEPNGYLHIGHAKSIILNHSIAVEYNGLFNLRFDDTNPSTEDIEFVDSIIEDVKWLKADFGNRLYFASDYFEQFYDYAIDLIRKGKAYVCDLSMDEIKEYRGSLTEPGKESPYRNRTVEENLDLFERMRKGEYEDGSRVLRAKIDMSSPNLNMRDPPMYRILHRDHHRTGNKWCIYPMYDWAHGLEDSIEGITHSICTLEFENHRPLYDWFLENLGVHHPQQIEFARLNLSYTVLSKRKLKRLVEEGHVDGWNDPRMPTISGLRRRGYTADVIREFCNRIGVSKRETIIDISILESILREKLNESCPRVMVVLKPLRVVIENYLEDRSEELEARNHPTDESMGTRKVPFSRVLYIEREDFLENPPKKYYRLSPGKEVRLRYGFFIKCVGVIKDNRTGEIKELRCTYDPETRGGHSPDGRKVKATLHWVSEKHAIKAQARLYDRLFVEENPLSGDLDFTEYINPSSLEEITCYAEPSLTNAKPGMIYQFERMGYFCVDTVDSKDGDLVFNRTIALRDSWEKIKKKIQRST
ncbi:MAG: glutamine--tRNA ligase/YqeY domain fusion protein [Candidatus Hodarchaeales archaeon]